MTAVDRMERPVKKLLLIAVAAACMASPAWAARVEFFGSLYVTAATSECNGTPFPGIQRFLRYWPRNVGTNGAHTRLTVFDIDRRGAVQAYDLASGNLVGPDYQEVKVTVIKPTGGGASLKASMRLASQTPASPTPTTPSLAIKGYFKDYGRVGCTVTFTGDLTRNPAAQ
jgi:hypothetical protein